MAFEPISGTIGAIAFADQLFKRCVWLYGQYKITKKFGEDYSDYLVIYESEVWRFESVRDHSMFGLKETLVDDGQAHLRPALRNRFYQWANTFNRCDELINQCEANIVQLGRLGHLDDLDDESTIDKIPTSIAKGPSGLSTSTEVTKATTAVLTQNPQSSPMPTTAMGLVRQKTPTGNGSIADTSSPQGTEGQEEASSQTSGGVPGPQAPSSKSSKKKRFWFSRRPKNPIFAPAPHHRVIEPVAGTGSTNPRAREQEIQDGSSLAGRVSWISKRKEFLGLLEELKSHGEFFSDAIQIDQTQHEAKALIVRRSMEPLLARYRAAGDKFQEMRESISQIDDIGRLDIQLMMHEDPFRLQTQFRESSGDGHFRPSSAAFYTRPIISAAQLQTPRVGEDYSSWAVFLGQVRPSIYVIDDITPHSGEKTLGECLQTPAEQAVLRLHGQAKFRARLGLVISVSFFLLACGQQSPTDLTAQGLRYHPALDDESTELELSHSRINPYVQIRVAPLAMTKMYEIGAWTVLAERNAAQRLQVARKEKEMLAIISPEYRDCIGACLEFTGGVSVGNWMLENVLARLKRTVDMFDKIELLP